MIVIDVKRKCVKTRVKFLKFLMNIYSQFHLDLSRTSLPFKITVTFSKLETLISLVSFNTTATV